MNHQSRALPLIVFSLLTIICFGIIFHFFVYSSSPKPSITGISKSGYTGEKYTLKLKGASGKVSWSITPKKLASVKKKGSAKAVLTLKKQGIVTIKAKYKEKTYKKKVSVKARNKTKNKAQNKAKNKAKNKANYICKDTETDVAKEREAELDEDELKLPVLVLPEDIPSYWKNELTKSVAVIRKRIENEGDMSSFIFLTDPHWKMNAKHSPAIINYLSSLLNPAYTICDGDVITYNYTADKDGYTARELALNELRDFYAQFNSKARLLSSVGNHDTNSDLRKNDYNGLKLTNHELFNTMFLPSKIYAHVYEDQLECYADDTRHKVRYISFFWDGTRTEEIGQDKLDWIDERVTELGSDWTVVLFSHAYWRPVLKGLENPVTVASKRLGRHFANLDASSKAEIALWMVGHCHRDLDTRIASDDGIATLRIVSTNCDSYYVGKSYRMGGLDMMLHTDTEQVLDYVQINTKKRWIYITRIGAGKSRNFVY